MTNPFSPPDAPVADPAAPPVRAFGAAPISVPVLPGIHRHHPWARWLGLLAIAGFALNFALDPWIAAKGGTAAPGVGRAAFFVALCVGWGWTYGFSAKGRAWFDPRPALPDSA